MQIEQTSAQAENMAIVRTVLEGAICAGDDLFINACNRLIVADARGETVESLPGDWLLSKKCTNRFRKAASHERENRNPQISPPMASYSSRLGIRRRPRGMPSWALCSFD